MDDEEKLVLPMWARRLGAIWDWVDKRDIDKHAVSVAILFGTYHVVNWAMTYANTNAARPGIEVAAIIAAVGAPYMALQAAAISFYFKARTTE